MSNMSYCRFQNTLSDLFECREAMEGYDELCQIRDELSKEEYESMKILVGVCEDIVRIYENWDYDSDKGI
jgi:hypothetical protein